MADPTPAPVPQPDNTEWVVVKHVRFPIAEDAVLGRYPTVQDASEALNEILLHPQWFTSYEIEHRNK